MWTSVMAYWDNEDGATSIEYALMAALIGVAVIAGMSILGTGLGNEYTEVSETVEEAY